MVDYESIVGKIYDCAANPELWSLALGEIRDAVGAAHVAAGYIEPSARAKTRPAAWQRCDADWDESWLDGLNSIADRTPEGTKLHDFPLDVSWTQLAQKREEDFRQTALYQEWFKPQKLRDCLSVKYHESGQLNGILAIPTSERRAPISAESCRLAEKLSPHIRRAMVINDLTNNSQLMGALFRQVLDRLTVAVYVIGAARRLLFTNATGDVLLSDGNLLVTSRGELRARRVSGNCSALDEAIDRAIKGDRSTTMGGVGVPLVGDDGERAAAYVLPIAGTDLRGATGQGHCAVFIAQRNEQQTVAIEILRMIYDLTPAEARVSCLVSRGGGPAAIAEGLGISINTVRTHLKHAFAKTNAADQTALGALVNGLMPPVT
jgi:DNA-binding CsgD family transcriptional regulator